MNSFWNWYNKHLLLNTSIAVGLFLLQLIHLLWLTTNVIFQRVGLPNLFPVSEFWQWLLVLVDYTEIPAIITTSFIYINDLRRGKNNKAIIYLLLLNSQWIHMFWITDEFVVEHFANKHQTIFSGFVAWIAILIDYLELPVIFDTVKRLVKVRNLSNIKEVLKE